MGHFQSTMFWNIHPYHIWLFNNISHELIKLSLTVVLLLKLHFCVICDITKYLLFSSTRWKRNWIDACAYSVYRHVHTHAHNGIRAHTEDHPSSSVTGCSGVRGHPGLCLFLSHLEAGVTLRAARSSPPHCSCEDRFHRDKATHCSAHSAFHQMCIITSSTPAPTSLSHTHVHYLITHIFSMSFHDWDWKRSSWHSSSLGSSFQLFYPMRLDLEQQMKTVRVPWYITPC